MRPILKEPMLTTFSSGNERLDYLFKNKDRIAGRRLIRNTNWSNKATNIIKISLHNMNIIRQCLQVIICLFCAKITCTENMLNFSWNKKGLEASRNVDRSMWDVEVTTDENKLYRVGYIKDESEIDKLIYF